MGQGKIMEIWYDSFSVGKTARFVFRSCSLQVMFYLAWAAAWIYVQYWWPEEVKVLRADYAIKTMTFLVGLLTSLTFKESLERYKFCLASLIDFIDEARSFWYITQMQLLNFPAAALITDSHMILFVLSLVRFLALQAGVRLGGASSMVQEEFRNCVLFADDVSYGSICSNPLYSELVLVSWLRTVGLMDRDLRQRFALVRTAMHRLLTSQKVRSPRTSVHLLRTVAHVFLLMLPPCSESVTTKVCTPVISLLIFALLALSEEFEDPFGRDEHDLPWPYLLNSIASVSISPESEAVMHETIGFFNDGATHSHWDEAMAKRLFGDKVKITTEKGSRATYDSFKINFSLYLTLQHLRHMDVVGGKWEGNPELISTMKNHDIRWTNGPPTDDSASTSASE